MFIVSKALLISSAPVILRAGGDIWLNPFATVSFTVCSAVTVECCILYLCCRASLHNRKYTNVFVGFWDGDYVSQLPYVWYYVAVKSSFQHAREECESKRAYVF